MIKKSVYRAYNKKSLYYITIKHYKQTFYHSGCFLLKYKSLFFVELLICMVAKFYALRYVRD